MLALCSDKTWFRSMGRILANDEHDWLFQGIEEQFNVELDGPDFDWHSCSLLLRLHILRALLECQLLVNPLVQRQLSAALDLQQAQEDHDNAVQAALEAAKSKGAGSTQGGAVAAASTPAASASAADAVEMTAAERDRALRGNGRVAAALKALVKAQNEHAAAFALDSLPAGNREDEEGGWGTFGFEWPIPEGSRRTPVLPMETWGREQLQAADDCLLQDAAGWRYMLLTDSAGGARLGRWRHHNMLSQLSPLREAQLQALRGVYEDAHAAASKAAVQRAGLLDDDSSGHSSGEEKGGGKNAKGTLAAFFAKAPKSKSSTEASGSPLPIRPSMLLGGGSDSEEGGSHAKSQKMPTLPAAFVPSETDVAARIESSRASVVRLSLLRAAVACGVADADRLSELGGCGGGGSSAEAYTEDEIESILGKMHVQFRPQLPDWLQAELAGEVPASLYGLGEAQADLLSHSMTQVRQLAAALAPPAQDSIFASEDGASEGSGNEESSSTEPAVAALLSQLHHLTEAERTQLGTALREKLAEVDEYEEEQQAAAARAAAKADRIARTMAMLGAPRATRRAASARSKYVAEESDSESSQSLSSGSSDAGGAAAVGREEGLHFDSPSSGPSGTDSDGSDDQAADTGRARALKPRRQRGSKRSLNIESLSAFAYSQSAAVPARNKRRATRQAVTYTEPAQFKELDQTSDSE